MNVIKIKNDHISNVSKYTIKLSKDNIEDIFNDNISELDFNYNLEDTYCIYTNESNMLIGFIDFYITGKEEDDRYIRVSSFEIFDDYRSLGYGTQVISLIKDFYSYDIKGYSKPDDSSVNFWAINNAEFDSCENCEYCDDCSGSIGCDEPLDYVFIIKNNKNNAI